jgi:Escherichia/Staphylococcus phage prohead protease
MPKGKIENRRFAGFEMREVTDKPGTIAEMNGQAVVYRSLSVEMFGFREKFEPRTFAECLARTGCDLRALVDHNSSLLLGRQSAGTLRIFDTDTALGSSIDVPDVSYGRDVVVSVKRRDMTGMSFSFDEQEDTWEFNEDGTIVRTVRKADIYEVTVTGFPAYPETSVDVRSHYRATIERFEEIKRTTAPATPERSWLDDHIRLAWRLHEASIR